MHGINCTQELCYLLKCHDHLQTTLYGPYDSVCDENGVWYAHQQAFCQAYVDSGNSLSIKLCEDELSQPVACPTSQACCHSNCLIHHGFSFGAGKCEEHSFKIYKELDAFCVRYCDPDLPMFKEAICYE